MEVLRSVRKRLPQAALLGVLAGALVGGVEASANPSNPSPNNLGRASLSATGCSLGLDPDCDRIIVNDRYPGLDDNKMDVNKNGKPDWVETGPLKFGRTNSAPNNPITQFNAPIRPNTAVPMPDTTANRTAVLEQMRKQQAIRDRMNGSMFDTNSTPYTPKPADTWPPAQSDYPQPSDAFPNTRDNNTRPEDTYYTPQDRPTYTEPDPYPTKDYFDPLGDNDGDHFLNGEESPLTRNNGYMTPRDDYLDPRQPAYSRDEY